jgi:hypothetical protein
LEKEKNCPKKKKKNDCKTLHGSAKQGKKKKKEKESEKRERGFT